MIYRCATILFSAALLHVDPAISQDAQKSALQKDCESRAGELRNRYSDLMAGKRYWGAAGVLRTCADVWPNGDLNKMIEDAEIKEHLSIINNPKASAADKQAAMEMIVIDYPEHGKPYAQFVAPPERAPAPPQVFSGHAGSIDGMVRYCAKLAGVPPDTPRSRMTPSVLQTISNCVDQHAPRK